MVIFLYLLWFSLCSSLFWELRYNGVSGEKFGILTLKLRSQLLEFLYIERGLLEKKANSTGSLVCLLAKVDRLSVVALYLVSLGVPGRGNQR